MRRNSENRRFQDRAFIVHCFARSAQKIPKQKIRDRTLIVHSFVWSAQKIPRQCLNCALFRAKYAEIPKTEDSKTELLLCTVSREARRMFRDSAYYRALFREKCTVFCGRKQENCERFQKQCRKFREKCLNNSAWLCSKVCKGLETIVNNSKCGWGYSQNYTQLSRGRSREKRVQSQSCLLFCRNALKVSRQDKRANIRRSLSQCVKTEQT